jgi:hypothetical protein
MVTMSAITKEAISPGNAYYPASPPMRQPGLSFLYRLECTIDKEDLELGPAHGTGVIRSIAQVTGGTFKGPELEGIVLPLGAADWATVIEGTHVCSPNSLVIVFEKGQQTLT